jgi:hypothetical protein
LWVIGAPGVLGVVVILGETPALTAWRQPD